jgi:hypothetical protein
MSCTTTSTLINDGANAGSRILNGYFSSAGTCYLKNSARAIVNINGILQSTTAGNITYYALYSAVAFTNETTFTGTIIGNVFMSGVEGTSQASGTSITGFIRNNSVGSGDYVYINISSGQNFINADMEGVTFNITGGTNKIDGVCFPGYGRTFMTVTGGTTYWDAQPSSSTTSISGQRSNQVTISAGNLYINKNGGLALNNSNAAGSGINDGITLSSTGKLIISGGVSFYQISTTASNSLIQHNGGTLVLDGCRLYSGMLGTTASSIKFNNATQSQAYKIYNNSWSNLGITTSGTFSIANQVTNGGTLYTYTGLAE